MHSASSGFTVGSIQMALTKRVFVLVGWYKLQVYCMYFTTCGMQLLQWLLFFIKGFALVRQEGTKCSSPIFFVNKTGNLSGVTCFDILYIFVIHEKKFFKNDLCFVT